MLTANICLGIPEAAAPGLSLSHTNMKAAKCEWKEQRRGLLWLYHPREVYVFLLIPGHDTNHAKWPKGTVEREGGGAQETKLI